MIGYLCNGSSILKSILQKDKQGEWHLLLMDGHGLHHIYKFLKFCDDHKIKVVAIPLYTTHLLQSLDVCVFQPLKHWHSKTVNEAVLYKTAMKPFLR